MSDVATTAAAGPPDDDVVSIAKRDLVLLVKAADLLLMIESDPDRIDISEIEDFDLAVSREATDADREVSGDPDLDEIVQMDPALETALARAAALVDVQPASVEYGPGPEMAPA